MVPRVLGVVPRVLGVAPRVLGVAPRVLGVGPRVLGVAPRVLGLVPRVLNALLPSPGGTPPARCGGRFPALGTHPYSSPIGTSVPGYPAPS